MASTSTKSNTNKNSVELTIETTGDEVEVSSPTSAPAAYPLTNGSTTASPTEATKLATQMALAKAKEVIKNGGTQEEAAVAAKAVARMVLREHQVKNPKGGQVSSSSSFKWCMYEQSRRRRVCRAGGFSGVYLILTKSCGV